MNDKTTSRNYMMNPDEQPPFADFMGMKITHVSPERVTGELLVTDQLTNRNGVLHGGALMAFADNLGGTAATANVPLGRGSTTTIESKTNFIGGAKEGTTVIATATPVHRGRRTQVWQTRLETEDGKLVAVVTQTQMVL